MDARRLPILLTMFATIIAWTSWGATVTFTDPTSVGWTGFALFYLTFFLAVTGTVTVMGTVLRRRAADVAVAIAMRQGVLVGVGSTVAVLLQAWSLLTWINMILLVASFTLLELALILLRRSRSSSGHTSAS
ncbi:hypothetical protein HY632_03820 [Candidatus Uhrbacteria bacterium]|nr:hypothetical protein [Candidatus Uhrbacteria bacterium]